MRLTRFGHPVVVAAAILALWIPAEAAAQKETETVNRTVPLPSHGTLRLKNFSGNVHLTPASGNDVVIKAVRVARREQLDHIKLEIDTTGQTVSIDANKRDADWRDHNDNVVETTFDIQVPAAAMLDVYGFSSDLDIRGITGDQKLETFSGSITVEGAKGAMELKTFSGRIDVNLIGAGTSPSLSAGNFQRPDSGAAGGERQGPVELRQLQRRVQQRDSAHHPLRRTPQDIGQPARRVRRQHASIPHVQRRREGDEVGPTASTQLSRSVIAVASAS